MNTETVRPGQYFYTSWGYDQTQIDYICVVRVSPSGKTCTCRMAHKIHLGESGTDTVVMPDQYNKIRKRITELIGQGMLRKEAEAKAWDEFAETPEGDAIIKETAEEVFTRNIAEIKIDHKAEIDKAIIEISDGLGSPPAGFQADQPKQPWEMTSDEFAIYQLTEVNGFEKRGDKWYRPDAEGKYQEATAWAERMLKEHKGGHKYSVEKALAEGKTVPPEVLADYPELALKNILISLRPGQVSKPPIYNTNRKGYQAMEIITGREARLSGIYSEPYFILENEESYYDNGVWLYNPPEYAVWYSGEFLASLADEILNQF